LDNFKQEKSEQTDHVYVFYFYYLYLIQAQTGNRILTMSVMYKILIAQQSFQFMLKLLFDLETLCVLSEIYIDFT